MTCSTKYNNLYLKYLRYEWHIIKYFNKVILKNKDVYVSDRIHFYRQLWESEAKKLSAKFSELDAGIWKIDLGNETTIIYNHKLQFDDTVISSLTAHKPLCYVLMKARGIPIPKYMTFKYNELEKGQRFMEENEGFFVIKPAIGTSAGMGVTTHVKSFNEYRKAIALASLYCNEVIIERMVPGECYRILVVEGKMVHAVRRRGVWVKGDGTSSIRQLMERDIERFKSLKGNDFLMSITGDLDLVATLHAQGLTSESIPKANSHILVKSVDHHIRKKAEVRTVYNENVTRMICDDVRAHAEEASKTVNSKFTGIDIITVNPTVPLAESRGIINEINSNPGLHHHYNLDSVDDVSPAEYVLKRLLKINS